MGLVLTPTLNRGPHACSNTKQFRLSGIALGCLRGFPTGVLEAAIPISEDGCATIMLWIMLGNKPLMDP